MPKAQHLVLHWNIDQDTFIYKNRIKINFITPDSGQIINITFPHGDHKYHRLLGNYITFTKQLDIPVHYRITSATKTPTVKVIYQGCTTSGVCYPPVTNYLTLNTALMQVAVSDHKPHTSPNTSIIAKTFTLMINLFGFLAAGLLLSFTPCVLPMVPILSALILGQQKNKPYQGFLCASLYVLSMAITYALIGLCFALMGKNIQNGLQTPVGIILMSLVVFVLGLSMLGLFEFRLPLSVSRFFGRFLHAKFTHSPQGIMLMGVLATLIVSPCTTPALVAALAYIGQRGNLLFGMSALFLMGIGMGIPLIILSTFGSRFIPKAGPWMNAIKSFLGLLLFGLSIMMLSRLLPNAQNTILWGGFFIVLVPLLVILMKKPAYPTGFLTKLTYTIALPCMFYAGYLISLPLSGLFQHQTQTSTSRLLHQTVYTPRGLKKALAQAKAAKKAVLIDVYATWCLDCNLMDTFVFKNNKIKTALTNIEFIRVDVSVQNKDSLALLKQFKVIGPPTLILINSHGQTQAKLIGLQSARTLLPKLNALT